MAISYDPKRWAYGNEFTPDVMNHIENGIKAATDEANRIDTAKVDKVNGKVLSTNDYTNADKQKVADAATTATVTALADDVSVSKAELRVLGWNVPSGMTLKNTVENGVFTQKVGRVDLGSLSWDYDLNNGFFYSSNIVDVKIERRWDGVACYNSFYPSEYGNLSSSPAHIVGIYDMRVYVIDSAYNDASTFVNHVKGKYLYYELSTPITHNLTDMPSQKSMISDEWNSSKTYAVGSYAIYQNQLYKCIIQNSGQNPLTATSYWQMVKVTDIVGSGGVTYEKVYITPNYGSISGVESRNFYVTDSEHSFIELHFVIMSGNLPADVKLFTLPNWASNFPPQYGVAMHNQTAYIAYNNIDGFYVNTSGNINALAGTMMIRK